MARRTSTKPSRRCSAGSPAGTTRGFGVAEFQTIGRLVAKVLDGLAAHGEEANAKIEAEVKAEAIELCRRFPIYA